LQDLWGFSLAAEYLSVSADVVPIAATTAATAAEPAVFSGSYYRGAKLYQFFAVSLNNLILSVNNENTQAHTARWGCEKGKPFVR